jgi:hypothetical protein
MLFTYTIVDIEKTYSRYICIMCVTIQTMYAHMHEALSMSISKTNTPLDFVILD